MSHSFVVLMGKIGLCIVSPFLNAIWIKPDSDAFTPGDDHSCKLSFVPHKWIGGANLASASKTFTFVIWTINTWLIHLFHMWSHSCAKNLRQLVIVSRKSFPSLHWLLNKCFCFLKIPKHAVNQHEISSCHPPSFDQSFISLTWNFFSWHGQAIHFSHGNIPFLWQQVRGWLDCANPKMMRRYDLAFMSHC